MQYGKKLMCSLSAAALSLGAFGMSVAPAMADSTANTFVKLTASSDNLSVTAPTSIAFSMKADGTFTAPAASSTTIVNNSVFPVKVTNWAYADGGKGKAVAQSAYTTAQDKNAYYVQVKTNASGAAFKDLAQTTSATDTSWDLGLKGSSNATLQLSTQGAMKNIDGTVDYSTQQTLGTVTFHFAAGHH